MKAIPAGFLLAILGIASSAAAQAQGVVQGQVAADGAAPGGRGGDAPGAQPGLPSAGGLTAPGAIPRAQRGPASATEARLDASEADDAGRGLTWLWLDVEGGYQHVGLETFDVDKSNLTAGLVPAEASGAFVGAGLGVQLLYFRIGPRGRLGFFPDWRILTVGGEVGLRLPLGFLEPHVELGGGYVALGNLEAGGLDAISKQTNIHGGYGRVGGGLDVFLGKVVSLGPYATWEFMGLKRPGVDPTALDPTSVQSLTDAQREAAKLEGSGYGSAVSAGVRLGLSF